MRPSPSRGRVAALSLGLAVTVAVVAACAPMTPPDTTTTSTTTTSTTTTSTTTTTLAPQPPVAVAAATPTAPGFYGLPVAFSSAGSNDPDGTIVSYAWTFGTPGPGGTSSAANPTTTYSQPGTYSVTLTVTDNSGLTGSTTISVNQPAPVGDVVLSSNPVTVPAGGSTPVKVWWNNQAANKLIYVDICIRPSSSPGFEPGQDCSPLSSLTPNGNASGQNLATVDVFRGPEPSGDLPWGCFAAGDTAPAGIQKLTTCYVRVTNNSLFNNTEAREAAFTVTG